MVKRRTKKVRRKPKQKIPIATFAGLAAGLASPAQALLSGNIQVAFNQLSDGYTGFRPADGSFDISRLKTGVAPLLVGALVSTVASKAGVNRRLKDIPFIKI